MRYIILCLSFCFVFFLVANAQVIERAERVDNIVEMDTTNKDIWWSFVIDSTYLGFSLPNGELPRRENGTYLYWKENEFGELMSIKRYGIKIK